MDWHAIIGVIVGAWLLLSLATEGDAVVWTYALIVHLPLEGLRAAYYWWRPRPCHCGHMPPTGAKWCPRCGLDVREWRERGVRARRG